MTHRSKALIVVTSHDTLGSTGRKTGVYLDELATPYWAFRDAGLDVEIASISGGKAPVDPGSIGEPAMRPAAVQRFLADPVAAASLDTTTAIATIDARTFEAVFLPGGHGAMWDFTAPALAAVIGTAWDSGAVVGAVCHGPAGLVAARRADGLPLVAGLKVNSFTDAEEAAVGLTDVVPFLLEKRLRVLGARFEAAANFQPHAVRDGRLITGQNPQSIASVARLMIEALAEPRRYAA